MRLEETITYSLKCMAIIIFKIRCLTCGKLIGFFWQSKYVREILLNKANKVMKKLTLLLEFSETVKTFQGSYLL